MRRFTSRKTLQTVTELNVTPLIDLAFVLLIIFMITTPLIEANLDLIVPTSKSAEGAPDPKNVRMVEIDRAAMIKLDNTAVSIEELRKELSTLVEREPKTAVAIRADRDLTIQVLISLMDVIKEAGITKVGLLTHSDKSPAARDR